MRKESEANFWLDSTGDEYGINVSDNKISVYLQEKYVVLRIGISGCNTSWFLHGSNKQMLRACNSIVRELNASLRQFKKEVKKLEDKNESGQEDKGSS